MTELNNQVRFSGGACRTAGGPAEGSLPPSEAAGVDGKSQLVYLNPSCLFALVFVPSLI